MTKYVCTPSTLFLILISCVALFYIFKQYTESGTVSPIQLFSTCCSICLSFMFMTGLCVYNVYIAWFFTIIACVLSTLSVGKSLFDMYGSNLKY